MDNIQDILNGLSPEDMASLQSMADAMFGGSMPTPNQTPPQQATQNHSAGEKPKQGAGPDLFSGMNPEMFQTISQIMQAMQKKDNRSDLIQALKPFLGQDRRKRADQALQMIRMMEMLPMLQQGLGMDAGQGD